MKDNDIFIMAEYFDDHVGKHSDGFHYMNGGYSLGSRNEKETKLLEFCDTNNLLV